MGECDLVEGTSSPKRPRTWMLGAGMGVLFYSLVMLIVGASLQENNLFGQALGTGDSYIPFPCNPSGTGISSRGLLLVFALVISLPGNLVGAPIFSLTHSGPFRAIVSLIFSALPSAFLGAILPSRQTPAWLKVLLPIGCAGVMMAASVFVWYLMSIACSID